MIAFTSPDSRSDEILGKKDKIKLSTKQEVWRRTAMKNSFTKSEKFSQYGNCKLTTFY